MKWQTIESAPKDGKLFLCWVKAERHSNNEDEGSAFSCDVSDMDFGWFRDMPTGGFYENMAGQIGDFQDITHWMPLPDPPQVTL